MKTWGYYNLICKECEWSISLIVLLFYFIFRKEFFKNLELWIDFLKNLELQSRRMFKFLIHLLSFIFILFHLDLMFSRIYKNVRQFWRILHKCKTNCLWSYYFILIGLDFIYMCKFKKNKRCLIVYW